MKKFLNFILVGVIFLFFMGCKELSKKGGIAISIFRTQNPIINLIDEDMNVVKYIVKGKGPKKTVCKNSDDRINNFKYTIYNNYVDVGDVIPGKWCINVEAYNKNNELIGKDTKTIKVYDRTYVNAFIFIKPLKFNTIVNHVQATPEVLISIPDFDMYSVKNVRILYCHSEYGELISKGLNRLDDFFNNHNLDIYNPPSLTKFKDINIGIGDTIKAYDLGNPDRTSWRVATEEYLNKAENSEIRIILWSWGFDQINTNLENINIYISEMEELIGMYPTKEFIYMTGPTNGTGIEGSAYLANQHIREHCINNKRWLLDVADIEKYDIDGNFYGELILPNGLYDTDQNGVLEEEVDLNWQADFEAANTVATSSVSYWQNARWYECSITDYYSISANMKAYAAWYMLSLVSEYLTYDNK